jgi:hypothetical protein
VSISLLKRPFPKQTDRESFKGERSIKMKREEQREHLVDLDTVESVLSYLARFGSVPGCVPSHGFRPCARFGGCPGEETGGEPDE